MKRSAALALLLILAACGAEQQVRAPSRPMRVVSLDYCADQYVLELLPRERILALSPDATRPESYKRASAAGVRQVAARAEDVLVLRPDLVVRSYGGGPDAARFLAEAGVPVLQIGYAGDLSGVRRTLLEVADGLGERSRGEAIVEEMHRRLARLPRLPQRGKALYMTEAGVTAGPDTLVGELMKAAGFDNFQQQAGWQTLPLERLAYERPDLVAAASFGRGAQDGWTAARHPVAQAQLKERPVVRLQGAWLACGGWFVLNAVEAMAQAAR